MDLCFNTEVLCWKSRWGEVHTYSPFWEFKDGSRLHLHLALGLNFPCWFTSVVQFWPEAGISSLIYSAIWNEYEQVNYSAR